MRGTIVVGLLALGASGALARPRPPEAAGYLSEMERRGLVDRTIGSPARLTAEVRAADDELTAGQANLAAARLYGIVEGAAYADLSDSDDFQDAEYRLGIALSRGGGVDTARRYLERSLARGPKAIFYLPALRAYVDLCLEARAAVACVQALDRLHVEDVGEEVTYLRGRSHYDHDERDLAEEELKRVGPKSRFYSSALYLRGVIRVKKADFAGAKDAFCSVADVKDGDTLRFYIDGRYYQLRDLARLALGRVAHEEGKFEDAFYHYFLIPSDSNKLPDALFEAAWSSLERREFDLGARLIEEFSKSFPHSPRATEGRLLRATLEVKTCRFADAEKGFDEFIRAYAPLMNEIDRALADPTERRAIAQRLFARALKAAEAGTPPEAARGISLEELLDVDPAFYRLAVFARGLRDEARDAGHVEEAWRALVSKVGGTRVQSISGGLDAATLLERTGQLSAELQRARSTARAKKSGETVQALAELEKRRSQLSENLAHVLDAQPQAGAERSPSGLLPLIRADSEHAAELRARTGRLQRKLEETSSDLVLSALSDLRGRTEEMVRRARLGKIDAVVGQKRKLEREIEDLAAGRFPAELFGKLHLEGLISDDEEYWPPEAERWADEYEGYK